MGTRSIARDQFIEQESRRLLEDRVRLLWGRSGSGKSYEATRIAKVVGIEESNVHSFYNPILHKTGRGHSRVLAWRKFCEKVIRDSGLKIVAKQAAERGELLFEAVAKGAKILLDGCEVVHHPLRDDEIDTPSGGDDELRPEDPTLSVFLARLSRAPADSVKGLCLLTHQHLLAVLPDTFCTEVSPLTDHEIANHLSHLKDHRPEVETVIALMGKDRRAITLRAATELIQLEATCEREPGAWGRRITPAADAFDTQECDSTDINRLFAAMDSVADQKRFAAWWLLRVLGFFRYPPRISSVNLAWGVVAKQLGLPHRLPFDSADAKLVAGTGIVKFPADSNGRCDAHQTVRTFYAHWWQQRHPAVWKAVQLTLADQLTVPEPGEEGWLDAATEKLEHAASVSIRKVFEYFKDEYWTRWQKGTWSSLVYELNLVDDDAKLLNHFLDQFMKVRPTGPKSERHLRAAAAVCSFMAARNHWHLGQLGQSDRAFGWAITRLMSLGWIESAAHARRLQAEVNATQGRIATALDRGHEACEWVHMAQWRGFPGKQRREQWDTIRMIRPSENISLFCDITLARVCHLAGGPRELKRAGSLFSRYPQVERYELQDVESRNSHKLEAPRIGVWSLIWWWWQTDYRLSQLRQSYSFAVFEELMREISTRLPTVPDERLSKLGGGVRSLALATLWTIRVEHTYGRSERQQAAVTALGHAREAVERLLESNQRPHFVPGHLIRAAAARLLTVRRPAADWHEWTEALVSARAVAEQGRLDLSREMPHRQPMSEVAAMWPSLADAFIEEARGETARFRLSVAANRVDDAMRVVSMTGYHRRDDEIAWAKAEMSVAARLGPDLSRLRKALHQTDDKHSEELLDHGRELVYSTVAERIHRRKLDPVDRKTEQRTAPETERGSRQELNELRAAVLARLQPDLESVAQRASQEVRRLEGEGIATEVARSLVFGIVVAFIEADPKEWLDGHEAKPVTAVTRRMSTTEAAHSRGISTATLKRYLDNIVDKSSFMFAGRYTFTQDDLDKIIPPPQVNRLGRPRGKSSS